MWTGGRPRVLKVGVVSATCVVTILLLVRGVEMLAQGARTQYPQAIQLFEERCAACHDGDTGDRRAPSREQLRQRTPEQVLAALTTGSMVANASGLSDNQKAVLSEVLTGRPLGASESGTAAAMPNRCQGTWSEGLVKTPMWNGWGADVRNTRSQRGEAAGLTAAQVPNLELRWAFGFPNGRSAFGQPTVLGNRVFVGSDTGFVYALNAQSGCVYWSFQARAGVRTAVSVGTLKGDSPNEYAIYFGDLKGYVYRVNASDGKEMWSQVADPDPLARITGAPTLADGRLLVPVSSQEEAAGPTHVCCKFRGSVVAYDVESGRQIWKNYTIADAPRLRRSSAGRESWGPAGGAVFAAPTVDLARNVVYASTGNAYTEPAAEGTDAVVAFSLIDGRRLWTRQLTENDTWVMGCGANAKDRDHCPDKLGPDFDLVSSPMLVDLPGGKRLLVLGEKSGLTWALDPDKKGAVVWQRRVGQGSAIGGVVWGSATDGSVGYFANSDLVGNVRQPGGLFALDLKDGAEIWRKYPPLADCQPRNLNCIPAQLAAISLIPGVIFSGANDGMMRAYATADGRVIWEFDTAREFETVNRVKARGGSINGPGPTIAGGLVLLNSGYEYLGTPGNVLLAFAPKN